jgi:hypothetical protein
MKKWIGITLTSIFCILITISIIMFIIKYDSYNSTPTFLIVGATYILGLVNIFILEKGLPRTISKTIISIINIPIILAILFFTIILIYPIIKGNISGIIFLILFPVIAIILSIEEYLIIKMDKKTSKESIRIWYIILGIISTLIMTTIITLMITGQSFVQW